MNGEFAAAWTGVTEAWVQRHGPLPGVLCGMVGSSIGWLETPYLPCPTQLNVLASAMAPLDGTLRIVPGLSCRNRCGAPDFMRGEETQILGAIALAPTLQQGRHLLCLPGTHTKWALVDNGQIQDFLTAPVGELFELLRQFSVLTRGAVKPAGDVLERTFSLALTANDQDSHGDLIHRLFECRSRVLAGDWPASEAAGFLSGLLISDDVRGALRLFAEVDGPITVIGTPQLTTRYAAALAAQHRNAIQLDGSTASLRGLTELYLGHLREKPPHVA